jgi:2-amino-4-hydroxy-6-hydroxymethyldihydropteridine diphosphokinase
MKAGIALGSNLGDRLENLRGARKKLVDFNGAASPILSSAIYETDPVGCEPGAGKFLNAVIEFEYDGDPEDLLDELRAIETSLGRGPEHERNKSRTIDLDLLYFGENKIDNKKLQLPHPRMHLRKFVLAPLADIRPDLILRGQSKTVRELLASADESATVVRLASDLESR